jgi:ribonuclease HII
MSQKLVLGIDEAGRGPGLGPMVLAAVALDEPAASRLVAAGIRDSKAFGSNAAGRQARAKLADLVRRYATWSATEVCQVDEIDAYVGQGRLNELERQRARKLIDQAPPCHRIIADGRALFSPLNAEHSHLEARDRAESAHPAVAAASVCAKAMRDELFEQIAARHRVEFGELRGGGYVNPATCAFVAAYVQRHGCLPPEARKSWPWRGIDRGGTASVRTHGGSQLALPSPRVR